MTSTGTPQSSRPQQASAHAKHTRPRFKERLERALASPNVTLALDRALPSFRAKRLAAFEGLDFKALQAEVAARRRAAVERLPGLIRQFTEEAEKVGANVYFAATPQDARRIVGEIVQRHSVKLAVKSKSMATEEIELNPYLESLGVQVIETDLGEWIVQLAGDHPSHLIVPAVHRTREEIAALFSKLTGEEVPPEPEALVAVARKHLRRFFIEADLGISGANIAIAETGTLVIVTNEGNSRLATGLPPVHLAVLGVEKLVPTLEDATAILKVLARSATGQKLTTYVSFITGPSRTADIELTLTIGVQGPKELHIILLDNNRLTTRESPRLREVLQCIRCGACANVCPPFQEVSGHAFGYIYTGPVGLMLTAIHHGLDEAAGPQSLCAQCNACETVCPAGIPLPAQIMEVRRQVTEKKGMPWFKRMALETLADPPRFERTVRLLSRLQGPFVRDGFVRAAPVPLLREQLRWRALPALARQPFRDRVRTLPAGPQHPVVPNGAAGLTVAYFPGCITDRLSPSTGEAVWQVLLALGCRVVFPADWSCCGLPAMNAGDEPDARRMARRTLEALEQVQADYIVSSSTSCVVAMRQDYLRILEEDPELRSRARALGQRIVDFTTFMDRVARLPAGALTREGLPALTVTYHDACQSCNSLGLQAEPRRLITDVLGLRLIEMEDSNVCCGFGGSFSLEHPRVAERIMRRKIEHMLATGAQAAVMDNPGCLMHLCGGLDIWARTHPGTRVPRALHLAELVAERIRLITRGE
jgi:L-lactate dehydrogenase complex protein LldF